jgi:hypothetical protein
MAAASLATQPPLRSETGPRATLSNVNATSYAAGESFLLDLLHLAGWQLQVLRAPVPRILASREQVELNVSGSSPANAAGVVFARAMRSGAGLRAAGER